MTSKMCAGPPRSQSRGGETSDKHRDSHTVFSIKHIPSAPRSVLYGRTLFGASGTPGRRYKVSNGVGGAGGHVQYTVSALTLTETDSVTTHNSLI